ncbi:galactose-1-phosphate uridylyltransferase [Streptococcus mutans]|nr:galactose-1-phosphate uridylyltransferase [Streptococcus mutans]
MAFCMTIIHWPSILIGVQHFHVQQIKRENISLIEAMGLAILPPRLKDELAEVEKYRNRIFKSANP